MSYIVKLNYLNFSNRNLSHRIISLVEIFICHNVSSGHRMFIIWRPWSQGTWRPASTKLVTILTFLVSEIFKNAIYIIIILEYIYGYFFYQIKLNTFMQKLFIFCFFYAKFILFLNNIPLIFLQIYIYMFLHWVIKKTSLLNLIRTCSIL